MVLLVGLNWEKEGLAYPHHRDVHFVAVTRWSGLTAVLAEKHYWC